MKLEYYTLQHDKYSKYFLFALLLHLVVIIFLALELTFPSNNPGNLNGNMRIIQATAISQSALDHYENQKQLQVQNKIRIQQEQKREQEEKIAQEKYQAEKAILQQKQKAEQKLQLEAAEKAKQQLQAQKKAQQLAQMKKNMLHDLKADIKQNVKSEESKKITRNKSEKNLNQQLKSDMEKQLKQDQDELNNNAAKKNQSNNHNNNTQLTGEIDKYKSLIIRAISQQWIVPSNLTQNISCELSVRVAPGGSVLSVAVIKSSGNLLLDNSAVAAVNKASPLPVPSDAILFNQFRELHLTVKPDGSMTEE